MARPFNKKQTIAATTVFIIYTLLTYGRGFLEKKQNATNSTNKAKMIITKHAACRMDCRHIDQSEVNEVLAFGQENKSKSNANARPCPTIVKEFRSSQDQQLIRTVVANCADKRKLVTVIDLENEYDCHCE